MAREMVPHDSWPNRSRSVACAPGWVSQGYPPEAQSSRCYLPPGVSWHPRTRANPSRVGSPGEDHEEHAGCLAGTLGPLWRFADACFEVMSAHPAWNPRSYDCQLLGQAFDSEGAEFCVFVADLAGFLVLR